MSVEGAAFLDFTEWLQQQSLYDGEIFYRCSINRAYYAAFHITKDLLRMGDRSNHRDVIQNLKIRDEYLGNRLKYFFDERKKADYRLGHNFRRIKADRFVADVKEFLDELGGLYGSIT